MIIKIVNPVRAEIEATDEELEFLKKKFTFKNKSKVYELKKIKNSKWLLNKYGEQLFLEKVNEVESQVKECALKYDGNTYYIATGLVPNIKEMFPEVTVFNYVKYPEFGLIPWKKQPSHEPRYYQIKAVEKMLSEPHSNIEFSTGCGKTTIIINLCKKVGLPSVISTPSASIARQVYNEMVEYFGKDKVGLFGDGKKEIGKFFLVSVAKSLAMVSDPEQIKLFKKYQVVVSDESHSAACVTFENFFTSLLAHCPYRWFVSATQMRGDGRDLVLEGITGKRVMTYTIQQAIDEGFLAKLNFLVFDVMSYSTYNKDNIVKMNQNHFYKNKQIIDTIASITNEAVVNQKTPVLILIDEYDQEKYIKPLLKCNYVFANGESDCTELVKQFNNGEVDCIIGTAAISTGTNLLRNKVTINWTANQAEIKIKQGAIGRSTRIHKESNKTSCTVIDFRVTNVDLLYRHANTRISFYNEINNVNIRKI